MSVKEDRIERLMDAMFNLMSSMKGETEQCCTMFGNLNEKEFSIICTVGNQKNVKMSDLAVSLSAPVSTITSIVDKLVKKKYLSRYHSDEDRRVILVTLASKGKEMFGTIVVRKTEMATKILKPFKLSEQDSLIEYLERIPSAINSK